MLVILTDAFRKGDSFLKENERKNTSALILTGGWLESMHFATKLYQESKENKILMRIGEQKQSLETIIELLEKYNEDGESDNIIADFKALNESFQKINVSYKYVEPVTDVDNKITTIKNKMVIDLGDELTKEIIEKVSSIREKVISSQEG
jgi:glutamate mutase epsilon subunit